MRREESGLTSKGIDLVHGEVSNDEIKALADDGFIIIEPTNRIPGMQGPRPSTIYLLTDKGRKYVRQ